MANLQTQNHIIAAPDRFSGERAFHFQRGGSPEHRNDSAGQDEQDQDGKQ